VMLVEALARQERWLIVGWEEAGTGTVRLTRASLDNSSHSQKLVPCNQTLRTTYICGEVRSIELGRGLGSQELAAELGYGRLAVPEAPSAS